MDDIEGPSAIFRLLARDAVDCCWAEKFLLRRRIRRPMGSAAPAKPRRRQIGAVVMAKTRDLAKATLDELRRYLENPDNVKGKTGPELANEILIRHLSFRKFRKPGRRHKWEISGSGHRKRKFRRLEGDILAVCPDAFVLYRSRGGNSDWDGKYMIRKNARPLPPAEKIAYRLKVKFPSNPNYQIAPTTLAKQIQKAVGACERVKMIALADWQKLVQK
jgi:hypothetical protein